MIDKVLELQAWIKVQKQDRMDATMKLLREDPTRYKLSVLSGEFKAYEAVEDQIERILKEPSAT